MNKLMKELINERINNESLKEIPLEYCL